MPGPTAVASPEELIVATDGLLTAQVTDVVMLEVVGCPEPIWLEPYAENCAVCPTAVKITEPDSGRMEIVLSELHPASKRQAGSVSRLSDRYAIRRRIIGISCSKTNQQTR